MKVNELFTDEYQERYYRGMSDGLMQRADRLETAGYKNVAANLRKDANFYLTHAHNIAVRQRENEAEAKHEH